MHAHYMQFPKIAATFHEGVKIKHVHFMSPFTVVQQASNGGLLHDPKCPWSAQKVQTA